MKIFGLLCCFAFAVATHAHDSSNLVVRTQMGLYKGSIIQSRLGKDIYSYRGIRYAEAPIGEKRFKGATLAKQHSGVFDASHDGPSCPQPPTDNRVISEDCLRLNVYTTTSPQNSSNQQKDVVAFIHPGAFYSSSATSQDFGPQILLDRDIVLVTMNYRLGSLGFLSLDDERAPGNAGLKDQVLALYWIQINIAAFGGNPDSVTLMGYGSGAFSVSLHMLSPWSKGVFHRAIIMSGAATSQSHLPTNQEYLSKKQAEFLGCPTDNMDNMMRCMYDKPIEEYVKSMPKFAEFHRDPAILWSPVVEKDYSNHTYTRPFLAAQPIDLIRQRNVIFCPLITGINRDEFGYITILAEEQAQKGNNTIYDEFNNQWDKVAPISFEYERDTPRSQNISRELKSYYLKDQPVTSTNYYGLARLYADALTIFQTYRFERLMANYSSAEVYHYLYNYEGCESYAKWSNGSRYGVVHNDELIQLFKYGHYAAPCQADIKNVERLTGIIEHFAKTGKPIAFNNGNYSNIYWLPSTKDHPQYMEIASEYSMHQGHIYHDRMSVFEKLFPLTPISPSE